jgi:hypothetical protein
VQFCGTVLAFSHAPRTIKLKNMKRSIYQFALATALILTVGISSSFATPVNDLDNINASFHKDFRKAELLATNVTADYTKLTFKMNGMVLFAFYSGDGKLLAVTHNIVSTQLPIQLMMDLRRNYSDYWVSDLFECDADGNTSYFLTIENADSKVTLRSNGGDWETYTKSTKI